VNKPVECPRCNSQMEVGFVADGTHAGCQQQKWSPGTPITSFWMGLKRNADQLVPVTTLRCPKCGYLESYAISRTSLEG
jgi:predicted Zn-ribbon and HTH transcriptional regulator